MFPWLILGIAGFGIYKSGQGGQVAQLIINTYAAMLKPAAK